MNWDAELFDRFVDATVRMARGLLPGYGYPHVILPYPPEEEAACIEALRNLPAALHARGNLSSLLVPVSSHSASAEARYARWPLEDAASFERLESDFADLRSGLVFKVAESIVAEATKAGPPPDVILLERLGSLYPFGHVSSLLDLLYRKGLIKTVAVAYPGSAEGTRLHFLGRLDATGGYRGHIVT